MSAAPRRERPQDRAGIRQVLLAAFGRAEEADLVERLRAAGDNVLALVAADPDVRGLIVFSRLRATWPGLRAAALAPLAVAPARQGRGLGSLLVREGLRRLARAGEDLVLVLGEPGYYGRFGFTRAAAARLATPYDGPDLQALAFTPSGARAGGAIAYAPAFADLA